ncbi:CRISPR-associated protein Cas5 [Sulfolobus acidocaldarius SUSAZ]|nr:CRISPR-associated protein Cas5 [Sulfolobus acidocaldarius SUSAZ]
MYGILIVGKHHWGYSVRYPSASAGGESFPMPPVSTLIGALSRGYCNHAVNERNESCTKEFVDQLAKKDLFWITYGTEEPLMIRYSDLMREERVPYRQEKNRKLEEMQNWFGVSAFGKIYAPMTTFNVLLLLRGKEELWRKLAWQVTSLGSKESLVSVLKVIEGEVEEMSAPDEINTNFYFPSKCVNSDEGVEMPMTGIYKLSSKAPTSDEKPNVEKFVIPKHGPLFGGFMKVSNLYREECTVYKVNNSLVIVPKGGLRW